MSSQNPLYMQQIGSMNGMEEPQHDAGMMNYMDQQSNDEMEIYKKRLRELLPVSPIL